jgi:ABC-type phosphate transport system substrate-binding protein
MSSRARSWLGVSAACLLTGAFAACNFVVGAGDYKADLDASASDAPTSETFAEVGSDAPTVADATDAGSDTATVDTGAPDACWNPMGIGGRPCWACAPTNKSELENACTGAQSFPYDNSGLGLDGGVPPIPDAASDGGDSSPTDASPTDASATDASATDASVTDASVTDSGATDAGTPPPPCSSLSGGNVIYAVGSSAVTLFLGQIAQQLENQSTPVSVVYQSAGSCVGVSTMVSGTPLKGNALYWDSNTGIDPTTPAGQHTCALDAAGVAADIGFSDVFAESCQDFPSGFPPPFLSNDFGPIQTMTIDVASSTDPSITSISAEAAYLVFGFGGSGGHAVKPWTAPSTYYIRKPSSGTETMIGKAIQLPSIEWIGVQEASSSAVLAALEAAGMTGAPGAIGILSADYADPNSAFIRELAFQDRGQVAGFLPDSSRGAHDKQNVRDGHYPIWGPLHMFARLDASSGNPTKTSVQLLENIIRGDISLASLDIVSLYAGNSLIPSCAMSVSRKDDGGEISPSKPTKSCNCKFLAATKSARPASCKTCSGASDCTTAGTACNFGYCE